MNTEITTRAASAIQAERLTIIETRIRDNMNRVAESALDIGRCLNQAKDEKLVSHGEWQEWVRKHTGMSPRAAQYVMKAAREIPPTSALSMLEFSKVQALLTLPPEEREQFAADVDAESKSVRELKEAIKAKQEAEKAAAEAQKQAEEIQKDFDAYKGVTDLQRTMLEQQVNKLSDKLSQGNDSAQAEIISLQEDVEDLEAELEIRAQAEADAKRELLALRTQIARGFINNAGPDGLTPDDLGEAVHTFMGQADRLLYMRTQIAGADHNTRAAYRDRILRVQEWCERAMELLDTVDGMVVEE